MLSKQVSGSSWAVYATDDDASLLGYVRRVTEGPTHYFIATAKGKAASIVHYLEFREAALSLEPNPLDTPATAPATPAPMDEGPSRFSLLEID